MTGKPNNNEAVDEALRPTTFMDYVGQDRIKTNVRIMIEAAQRRKETLDHVLLYGPSGLGKTTLAKIIAREMNSPLRVTSGTAIERAGDLSAILANVNQGDVLFVDEIHRLNRAIEEVLYPAMEDYRLDVVIGKGAGARTLRIPLQKFTLVGATTRISLLSSPLRNRFGAIYHFSFYTSQEIEHIIERSAGILGVALDHEAREIIAHASRRTPRVANRLLKRARDLAQVKGSGRITAVFARRALEMQGIDEIGLEETDRKLLCLIVEKFDGGPVGLKTLAAMCGEEEGNVEEIYEPYLMQIGFIERTAQGRRVTRAACDHLALEYPGDRQTRLL